MSAILPEELSYKIMSYCDLATLGKCCSASKDWKRLASDDRLWKDLCQHMFPWMEVPNSAIKNYLKSHFITSLDDVINQVKIFADKIPENKVGQFTCYFPSQRCLTVTLGKLGANNAATELPSLKEFAIFLKNVPFVSIYPSNVGGHQDGLFIRVVADHLPNGRETLLDAINSTSFVAFKTAQAAKKRETIGRYVLLLSATVFVACLVIPHFKGL